MMIAAPTRVADGAEKTRRIMQLDLEDGGAPREWVDEFAKQGVEILESSWRTVFELTKSAPEIQGGMFLESIGAMVQESRSSSRRSAADAGSNGAITPAVTPRQQHCPGNRDDGRDSVMPGWCKVPGAEFR